MLNKQGFMELGWNNDVGSLSVKDQAISERARSDEERLIIGLKSSYGYVDHDDQADIQFQIVPEIHKEEENSEKDLTLTVPDEHSETDDHHHINEFSDSSDNQYYLRNKNEKPKRRRVEMFSDDESEGFTREVPTVTRRSFKRRRNHMMSNKMSKLQKLLPNCHKGDTVSVLDKAIEYMKYLQLQLQVMSLMGMNSYFARATLNFGMHNDLVTAMAMAQGINLLNQTTSSPFIPASNWPLPPFSNLSIPHTSNQSLFPTTVLPASSTQCLCGLVPCFPSFLDLSSHAMGGRL